MLVDLGRNDLGRVCVPGTVRVEDYSHIERYSHVMHLVSTVAGQVEPDRDALDVFDATFPAGTVSGAPKPRAMEIIESLEPTRRALYAGTVGYVDAGVSGGVWGLHNGYALMVGGSKEDVAKVQPIFDALKPPAEVEEGNSSPAGAGAGFVQIGRSGAAQVPAQRHPHSAQAQQSAHP